MKWGKSKKSLIPCIANGFHSTPVAVTVSEKQLYSKWTEPRPLTVFGAFECWCVFRKILANVIWRDSVVKMTWMPSCPITHRTLKLYWNICVPF